MLNSMLDRLREAHAAELEGDEAAEAGFTLIELMVVLLIIAILLAIAIPTFLGVTSTANDRAAQSNLTNGLTEAATQYQNLGQTYSGIFGALTQNAPEFVWEDATGTTPSCSAASSPNCLSVEAVSITSANDDNGVIISAFSKNTGTCWYVIKIESTPNTSVWSSTSATHGGTFYAKKTGQTSCSAASGPGLTWYASYTAAKTS